MDLLIHLSEAQLDSVRFRPPCSFSRSNLANVFADNISFDGCQLLGAVFSGASVRGAKFSRTIMTESKFIRANLMWSEFAATPNRKINFSYANLREAKFKSGPNPQGVDFTNADLYRSDITETQLSFNFEFEYNTLLNTRFPNGSFSTIDSRQLIEGDSFELSVRVCTVQYENTFFAFRSV